MKKKNIVSQKDKKDWENYTKEMGSPPVKNVDIFEENKEISKVSKLDLHGHSLVDANKIVKNFIIESFNKNCRKILIVTGKGTRSRSYDNPYMSKNFSILKNSVPDFIKNDENLKSIITSISKAEERDGGEGAINIFLKNNKKFIK